MAQYESEARFAGGTARYQLHECGSGYGKPWILLMDSMKTASATKAFGVPYMGMGIPIMVVTLG
jgi:hypothetical protein